jgi:DNA-binding protein HU-beta
MADIDPVALHPLTPGHEHRRTAVGQLGNPPKPTTQEHTSMNNADLAEKLAEAQGLTKADARKYVDIVFAAIADAATSGAEISLTGFGKFKVKDTPAREGRNPATGETMQIAASKKLTFSAAKAIKDSLNA